MTTIVAAFHTPDCTQKLPVERRPLVPTMTVRVSWESQERRSGEEVMPMHDWTKVEAGIFHAFHHRWISALSDVLNGGRLPADYYALPEQIAAGCGLLPTEEEQSRCAARQRGSHRRDARNRVSRQQVHRACVPRLRGQGV